MPILTDDNGATLIELGKGDVGIAHAGCMKVFTSDYTGPTEFADEIVFGTKERETIVRLYFPNHDAVDRLIATLQQLKENMPAGGTRAKP